VFSSSQTRNLRRPNPLLKVFCRSFFLPFLLTSLTEQSVDDTPETPPPDSSTGLQKIFEKYHWLFNFPLWCLLISSGFTYFILKGISDWVGLYIVESCHWSASISTVMLFWSEVLPPPSPSLCPPHSLCNVIQVGGMVGSLSSGIASDSLFHQRRDITSFFYTLLMIPAFLFIPLLSLQETPWTVISSPPPRHSPP
jgi:sugar phosphate permease